MIVWDSFTTNKVRGGPWCTEQHLSTQPWPLPLQIPPVMVVRLLGAHLGMETPGKPVCVGTAQQPSAVSVSLLS